MRRLFVAAGCAGTPVGTWLLHVVDPIEFEAVVGAILMAYCPVMLFIGAMPRISFGGRLVDGGMGLIRGVMGGLGGLNGPVEQRAVFQTFSLCMQSLALTIYLASGSREWPQQVQL